MKKLLIILMFPIISIGQTIRCSIDVLDQGKAVDDTVTRIEVINITERLTISSLADNLDVYLKYDTEYYLIFSKSNCITKQLYINTNNVPNNSQEYIVNLNTDMITGKPTDVRTTVAWYDSNYDCFRYKPFTDSLIKSLYKK